MILKLQAILQMSLTPVEVKGVARGAQEARPPPIEMFQVFKLNFSRDVPKMHYFSNKFSEIAKRWGFSAPAPLNFHFGELKLCNLAKLWFFKLIMTKLNFKKSIMTTFL